MNKIPSVKTRTLYFISILTSVIIIFLNCTSLEDIKDLSTSKIKVSGGSWVIANSTCKNETKKFRLCPNWDSFSNTNLQASNLYNPGLNKKNKIPGIKKPKQQKPTRFAAQTPLGIRRKGNLKWKWKWKSKFEAKVNIKSIGGIVTEKDIKEEVKM